MNARGPAAASPAVPVHAPDVDLGSLPGLRTFEAIRDGRLPHPPLAALIGATLVEVSYGRVTFRVRPGSSTLNRHGTVHGGVLAAAADMAAGCAAQTTQPARIAALTVTLDTRFLRSAAPGRELVVTGRCAEVGATIAFAGARIEDGGRGAVATATATLVLTPA